MLKLIIEDPGYTLIINDSQFRTPATVNIPLNKVHDIVRYLKSQGIIKYKFEPDPGAKNNVLIRNISIEKSTEDIVQELPITEVQDIIEKEKEEGRRTIIQKSDNSDELKELTKKFEKVEQILNKLADREPQQIIIRQDGSTKEVRKKEDDEKMFIPSIDTSDLKLKTSGSKSITSDIDLSGVESLRKIKNS